MQLACLLPKKSNRNLGFGHVSIRKVHLCVCMCWCSNALHISSTTFTCTYRATDGKCITSVTDGHTPVIWITYWCACVCVQMPCTDRLLRFSIKNVLLTTLWYSLLWSHTSLLWLLPFNRKVAWCSQEGRTRSGREAIAGCRHRVCSKAYSTSSYKHVGCVVFWSDIVQLMCFKLVWFHINQQTYVA